MICRQCGQEIDDDSKFCPMCGGSQMGGAPAEAEQAQPEADSAEPDSAEPDMDAPPEMPDAFEAPVEPEAVQQEAEPITPDAVQDEFAGVPFADAVDEPDDFTSRYFAPERAAHRYTGRDFAADWLGLILLGGLLIAAIVFGGVSGYLFAVPHLMGLLTRLLPIAMAAFAIAISTRAKGADLSVGAVIPLGAMVFIAAAAFAVSPVVSLVAALLACLIVGVINGVLIVVLRIPALIATILTAAAVVGVRMIFAWSSSYALTPGSLGFDGKTVALIAAGCVLVVCFLMVLLTKLGKPIAERTEEDARRPSYFVAYVLSALIAGVAGLAILAQTGMAPAETGGGYMVFVLLLFGILISNRRADNRYFPVIYALFAAVVYTLLVDIVVLYQLPEMVKPLMDAGLAILFVVIAFATRKQLVKGMARSS